MALLDILEAPDPRLTTVCQPVERIDMGLLRLLDDMLETMHAAPGIGLAAPQVGHLERACVIDLGKEAGSEPLFLINPEVIWQSDAITIEEEGCLSLPGFEATVARPQRAVVKGLNRDGVEQVVEGTGLLARCFQHEMDHLDGTVFVDRLRGLQKDLIVRRIRKLSKTGKW